GLNWYFGGSWRISSENTHQGATGSALSDSPSTNYVKPEDSVIQYRPGIDLTGSTQPALYFWTNYDVSNAAGNDKLLVEVAADSPGKDGELYTYSGAPVNPTWQATPLWSSTSSDGPLNKGWHLVAVNLIPYIGKTIHVRFRLLTNTDTTSASNGWY